jgi:hypothetical protein
MDERLDRIKQAMALELARYQREGVPPKGQVEALFQIPEIEQAIHLLLNRRRPLPMEPETREERQEVVDAIQRVAAWLGSYFDQDVADRLREIAVELE